MDQNQLIELWFHYEEIAMHFNELIIQYRLQLMGGAGIIGVLSGYLVGEKVKNVALKHKLRALVSTGILVLIIAAAFLDIFYYNQLLRGAVDAILELEKKHPELNMSTLIKARFCDPGEICTFTGATARIVYTYLIVIFPLLIFTIWAWLTHKVNKNS